MLLQTLFVMHLIGYVIAGNCYGCQCTKTSFICRQKTIRHFPNLANGKFRNLKLENVNFQAPVVCSRFPHKNLTFVRLNNVLPKSKCRQIVNCFRNSVNITADCQIDLTRITSQ